MNERVEQILHHPLTIPITVGVISFASGLGAGFFLGRRQKCDIHEFPAQMEFTFDAASNSPTTVKVDTVVVKPEPIVIDEDVLLSQGATFVEEKLKEIVVPRLAPPVQETVRQSIFAENDADWDYREEVKNRTTEAPHIIHKDEFYSNELDLTQTTLSYYAGDNIMADEDDTPVYNYDRVIGPLNFGHGSGDPNVFYVRNHRRKTEYEILYNTGLFSEEVLGLEIEDNERVKDLKHSNIQRFRPE